jgi:hypothetical protein
MKFALQKYLSYSISTNSCRWRISMRSVMPKMLRRNSLVRKGLVVMLAVASGIWAMVIIMTLLFLVPINNRLAQLHIGRDLHNRPRMVASTLLVGVGAKDKRLQIKYRTWNDIGGDTLPGRAGSDGQGKCIGHSRTHLHLQFARSLVH